MDICQICGKACASIGNHVAMQHKELTAKDYFDKYLIQPNEGLCTECGKPCEFLGIPRRYRQYCSNKCKANSNNFITKQRQTKLIKYGVATYNNRTQAKNTCIEKYGIENPSQLEVVKNKKITTMVKNYGVVNNFCRQEIIDKAMENSKEKTKLKENCFNKWNKLYTTGKLIRLIDNNIEYHCNLCGNNNISDYVLFRHRISWGKNPCTICYPISAQYSTKEKDIVEYIKNNYSYTIIENDRNILNGKEIDIYLPELKLGIEFNGTYWHADPRFYPAETIISHKNVLAKEIWANDEYKLNKCKYLGITLIQIKEYDWDTDKQQILTMLNTYLEVK